MLRHLTLQTINTGKKHVAVSGEDEWTEAGISSTLHAWPTLASDQPPGSSADRSFATIGDTEYLCSALSVRLCPPLGRLRIAAEEGPLVVGRARRDVCQKDGRGCAMLQTASAINELSFAIT